MFISLLCPPYVSCLINLFYIHIHFILLGFSHFDSLSSLLFICVSFSFQFTLVSFFSSHLYPGPGQFTHHLFLLSLPIDLCLCFVPSLCSCNRFIKNFTFVVKYFTVSSSALWQYFICHLLFLIFPGFISLKYVFSPASEDKQLWGFSKSIFSGFFKKKCISNWRIIALQCYVGLQQHEPAISSRIFPPS